MHVNDLLKIAVDAGASDLHLKVGSYPMMRVRGALVPATDEKRLDHEDVVAMSAAVMSTSQRQRFKEAQEVDLAYSVPGLGRFRCNIFQQRGRSAWSCASSRCTSGRLTTWACPRC